MMNETDKLYNSRHIKKTIKKGGHQHGNLIVYLIQKWDTGGGIWEGIILCSWKWGWNKQNSPDLFIW